MTSLGEPSGADFDDVARAMATPATNFSKENNKMSAGTALTPATPRQGVLDLGVEVERVVAGVEMGVLENGMPYLTQRGVAEMSGAARSLNGARPLRGRRSDCRRQVIVECHGRFVRRGLGEHVDASVWAALVSLKDEIAAVSPKTGPNGDSISPV